ncbi:HalX domain-containing protein [Natronolimnobius sp. AArcel1]|uniref:HalX domain-containing protein n=1 Tax=Natronolimnobius sp. AArcel1 TaxID=1679093 RepID=UPI0013ECDD41|nr:HalX domain-containing protein [Natronolimnobius sp. AArcel1]
MSTRPITPGKIEETVEQVCTRQVYESVIDDLWRVLHTKALLRKELNDEEIEKSDSYRVLQQHQSSLESLADELEKDLEKKDFTALFRDASSGSRLVRPSVN